MSVESFDQGFGRRRLFAGDADALPSRGQKPFGRARPGLSVAQRYMSRFDRGEVKRWAFFGLLLGVIGVLAVDFYDLAQHRAAAEAAQEMTAPVAPPVIDSAGYTVRQSTDPRDFVTRDEAVLRAPMHFHLRSDGVLEATGSINPGAAERLEAALDQHADDVRVVALDSPGGSLDDAIAMARILRERGIGTRVADGALCASSCPLVLSGGVTRMVGDKAAVGVHQFYAAAEMTEDPAQAMADAQLTTARIARHLKRMGVDPVLWLDALSTPPQSLYYLTPAEMADYRLVTRPSLAADRGSPARS